MKADFLWLTREHVLAIHDTVIRWHGGLSGVRDEGLLESALGRPQHLFAYGPTDLYDLAAAYAFGIAKNHPFLDGNKRTAFVAAYTFLGLNGWTLQATDAEVVAATLGLADGSIDEAGYARFLRDHSIAPAD